MLNLQVCSTFTIWGKACSEKKEKMVDVGDSCGILGEVDGSV